MKCICAAYVDSRKKHFEPPHDKTNKITFVPSEDSDQPGHPPSLIRVFAVHSVKLGYLVCAVTVHLLLFLFECHGNKEYVRTLACVRACVRTYL